MGGGKAAKSRGPLGHGDEMWTSEAGPGGRNAIGVSPRKVEEAAWRSARKNPPMLHHPAGICAYSHRGRPWLRRTVQWLASHVMPLVRYLYTISNALSLAASPSPATLPCNLEAISACTCPAVYDVGGPAIICPRHTRRDLQADGRGCSTSGALPD